LATAVAASIAGATFAFDHENIGTGATAVTALALLGGAVYGVAVAVDKSKRNQIKKELEK